MEMKAVDSSQIVQIGHDPETNTLRVQFHPPKGKSVGPVYEYSDVPATEHQALMEAKSVGSHFHHNIKNAKGARGQLLYAFRKVSA